MTDQRDDRNVIVNFLAGLGLGAVIGAAAALMLAPKPGTETREDLKVAAGDLKVKAGEVAEDLTKTSEDLIKKGKELLEITKSRMQGAIDVGKEACCQKNEVVDEVEKANI